MIFDHPGLFLDRLQSTSDGPGIPFVKVTLSPSRIAMIPEAGSFSGAVEWTAESIEGLVAGHSASLGIGDQDDAMIQSTLVG